jgi:hypothetical protein
MDNSKIIEILYPQWAKDHNGDIILDLEQKFIEAADRAFQHPTPTALHVSHWILEMPQREVPPVTEAGLSFDRSMPKFELDWYGPSADKPSSTPSAAIKAAKAKCKQISNATRNTETKSTGALFS